MNHILINATHEEEVRVAVVKNKILTDLDIESNLNKKNKGNIYKGRVSKIETSLEAAFVDYGKERQGFLPLKEISSIYYPENKTKEKLKISDILTENKELIVQIDKEERGNKGAALTTFVNLVGTYMIFMPIKNNGINISRQVRTSERKNLQDISKKLDIPSNTSIILRTVASGKSQEEIQWEIDYLKGLWNSILKKSENHDAPFLIYQESDIIIRSIRDYLRDDIDSMIIDDLKKFKNAKEFITFVLPHYLNKIKIFDIEEKSLFSHMGIENQVNNVFKREISLESGATVVFDNTEALTSIDINSARANKGNNIEDTAYKTNLEAAREIANQLRLRDVGGLIVIDFIDMNSSEHQKSIEAELQKKLSKDRARARISNISNFGLLEMSRQRICSSVIEATQRVCTQCEGRGIIPTIPGLALQILRFLEDSCNAAKSTAEVTIKSTIEVITYLLNEKRHHITNLEIKHQVKIILLPHAHKIFPYYEIKKKTTPSDPHHKSYQGISKTEILPDLLIKKPISDIPLIDIYRPNTPLPIKKISWLKNLLAPFSISFKSKKKVKETNQKRKYYKSTSNKVHKNSRRSEQHRRKNMR